jgi:hypothetical protein
MKQKPTTGMLIWMLCLGLLIEARCAHADTLGPPSGFDAYSAGSNYMVRISPKKGWGKPTAQVFRIADSKTSPLWKTKLSNDVAPLDAFLSDDGEHASYPSSFDEFIAQLDAKLSERLVHTVSIDDEATD